MSTTTLILSNRAPVRIVDADWPAIAHTALTGSGSRDLRSLTVRRHADGRAIVSAYYCWGGGREICDGDVVEKHSDPTVIPSVIRSVAFRAFPPDVATVAIRSCIAALPVEDLA